MRTVPPFAFCYSFFSPVGIAELYTRPGSGSACRRRGHPRPIAVPRPSPRGPLISNFLLACRRASFSLDKSLQKILEQVCNRLTASRSHREVTVCTARRRGVPFVRTKGTKIRLGLRPKTPTRRYTPPGKPKQRLPGAGLDDACKEQRRICPLPVPLPRFGGGASCPSVHFPKPSAFIILSAVLPLSANFPLSPPPQRRGQGWWFALPRSSAGAIKKRRRLLGSVSVRSTDDALHRSYPALQATKGGSSRGNLPLDPVLLPFAGAKGRPPRRAVLTKPFIRLRDADRRLQTIPHRAGVQVMPLQKAPPLSNGSFFFPPKKKAAGSRRLLIFSLITASRYPAW